MSIKYLDAKRLRRILVGGGNWLKNHEKYLNDLNVYPVPDGDTGTNMSMTASAMINDIESLTDKKTSMEDLANVVEEAVLMGARGNSGTIFSQIITGFLKGARNKKRMYTEDVYIALLEAKKIAYQTVENPVEGTILTVIREISEEAEKVYPTTDNLDEMIEKLVIRAKQSVESTPDLLPKLKEAGVVDSGGMGLFYFFEGIQKTLTEINLFVEETTKERDFNTKINEFSHDIDDIKFQYCTEFVITKLKEDKNLQDLKEELVRFGDSAVFAESSKKFKTHIHTNTPGLVLQKALEYGELEKVKVDNMKLQVEETSSANLSNIFVSKVKNTGLDAYIAIADTEELKDKFISLGADVVILGGQTKNPSTQDFISAIAKIDENKNILILPNNKNVIATAKLASDRVEQSVTVINTKTMLEGYFYLTYRGDNLSRLQKEMQNNYSIEITQAVRKTKINDMNIEVADYMAIVNGQIAFVNKDLDGLFKEVQSEYITENTINLTVVEGINTTEYISKCFEEYRKSLYGFVDVIKTNQNIYNYYILIENRDITNPTVAVVTDSSSDLTNLSIGDYPIEIVPLKVEIDGVTYLENIDLTKEELWEKLNNSDVVKTAQPSPKSLIKAYTNLIRRGYKNIYSIHISKGISGTVQTATVAKQNTKYPNSIHVVNSELVGIPLGILCIEVVKRGIDHMSISNIDKFIQTFIQKTKLYTYMESLDRLHKGGRLSTTSKTFADLLHIKPIITISNGNLVVEKKVIGEQAVFRYIEKQIYDMASKQSIYLYITWSGSQKMRDDVYRLAKTLNNHPKITVIFDEHIVGAVVGAHAGPMLGVFALPRLI